MTHTVLSIAGSDPTGGAGIQADLKTMTVLGVYGAAAVTCVTVQNSKGVRRVSPLSPELVTEQIESVLADHHVQVVKIGMIGTGEVARAVSNSLRNFKGEVVCDPVFVASTGDKLTDNHAVAEIITHLIPRTTVLTPNVAELEQLSGRRIKTEEGLAGAAAGLMHPAGRLRGVAVTGGDGSGAILTDLLVHAGTTSLQVETVTHPRRETDNSHGTGCTFSSALATYLCLGHDLVTAFQKSIDFVDDLLRNSATAAIIKHGGGKGPLLHHRS